MSRSRGLVGRALAAAAAAARRSAARRAAATPSVTRLIAEQRRPGPAAEEAAFIQRPSAWGVLNSMLLIPGTLWTPAGAFSASLLWAHNVRQGPDVQNAPNADYPPVVCFWASGPRNAALPAGVAEGDLITCFAANGPGWTLGRVVVLNTYSRLYGREAVGFQGTAEIKACVAGAAAPAGMRERLELLALSGELDWLLFADWLEDHALAGGGFAECSDAVRRWKRGLPCPMPPLKNASKGWTAFEAAHSLETGLSISHAVPQKCLESGPEGS